MLGILALAAPIALLGVVGHDREPIPRGVATPAPAEHAPVAPRPAPRVDQAGPGSLTLPGIVVYQWLT
jgi:hypothetical protein